MLQNPQNIHYLEWKEKPQTIRVIPEISIRIDDNV